MQDLTYTASRTPPARHSFDMGYDMEWVDLPEHAARLREEYQAALGTVGRKQKKTNSGVSGLHGSA
jgi:hypothetical protein